MHKQYRQRNKNNLPKKLHSVTFSVNLWYNNKRLVRITNHILKTKIKVMEEVVRISQSKYDEIVAAPKNEQYEIAINAAGFPDVFGELDYMFGEFDFLHVEDEKVYVHFSEGGTVVLTPIRETRTKKVGDLKVGDTVLIGERDFNVVSLTEGGTELGKRVKVLLERGGKNTPLNVNKFAQFIVYI